MLLHCPVLVQGGSSHFHRLVITNSPASQTLKRPSLLSGLLLCAGCTLLDILSCFTRDFPGVCPSGGPAQCKWARRELGSSPWNKSVKVCTDSYVSCPPPASVPWLRESDLGQTGMERHRQSDREVASSIITPVAAPLSSRIKWMESFQAVLDVEPHWDVFFPGCWGKLCWASPAKWTMKVLSVRPPSCLTSGSMEVSGITNLNYIYRLFYWSPYTGPTMRKALIYLLPHL